jgi:hypothetical protein
MLTLLSMLALVVIFDRIARIIHATIDLCTPGF